MDTEEKEEELVVISPGHGSEDPEQIKDNEQARYGFMDLLAPYRLNDDAVGGETMNDLTPELEAEVAQELLSVAESLVIEAGPLDWLLPNKEKKAEKFVEKKDAKEQKMAEKQAKDDASKKEQEDKKSKLINPRSPEFKEIDNKALEIENTGKKLENQYKELRTTYEGVLSILKKVANITKDHAIYSGDKVALDDLQKKCMDLGGKMTSVIQEAFRGQDSVYNTSKNMLKEDRWKEPAKTAQTPPAANPNPKPKTKAKPKAPKTPAPQATPPQTPPAATP